MPVIEAVVKAGLVPIVVGGGHNNAFPILKGASRGLDLSEGMGCINLDAHADFRPLEGRHSGNGFSYAYYQGFLRRYFVVGLNEQANSEAMLKNMDLEEGVGYQFYKPHGNPGVNEALQFLTPDGLPIGLEIDLDALAFMPASAFAVSGYNLDQGRTFIRKINQQAKPVYLHLAEGQVKDTETDARSVGKTLCALVLEFIKTYPD
jgi:formiminoglutamase